MIFPKKRKKSAFSRKNRVQNKLRSRRGMTLMEMLCAVVGVILISGLLTTGIQLSVRTFRRCMAFSQAQTLSSTLTTAITDKLRYCGTVTGDGKSIFIQDVGNVESGAFTVDDQGQVLLGTQKLLGKKTYAQGVRVRGLDLGYSSAERMFTVSFDITDGGDTVLAHSDFRVKRINQNNGSADSGEAS